MLYVCVGRKCKGNVLNKVNSGGEIAFSSSSERFLPLPHVRRKRQEASHAGYVISDGVRPPALTRKEEFAGGHVDGKKENVRVVGGG